MNFWQQLLKDKQDKGKERPAFSLAPEMLMILQEIAERDRRTINEVVEELLLMAIAQRQAAEAHLLRWYKLSPREKQVTALICLNYTNREIAAQLVISPETVKTHVRNILNKIGLHSKSDLRQALADWDFSAWQDSIR